MSTPLTVVLAVIVLAVLGLIGLEWPEIRRYMKIRSM
jgi:uncharacterized protein DUF6893